MSKILTTIWEPGNRAARVICRENLDAGLNVEVVFTSSDYKAWNFEKKSSTLSEYQRSDITRIVVTFCSLTIKRVNSTENRNDIMLDTFRS